MNIKTLWLKDNKCNLMCFKLYSRCIYMNYYVNFTTIFTSSTFVFGSTNVHVFKNPTAVQCIVYSRLYELFPKSLLPFSALICIFCCWLTCKSVQLLRTADVQTLSINYNNILSYLIEKKTVFVQPLNSF